MELDKARIKMRELLSKHGLDNWSFDFDRAVRRLGQCVWKKNSIMTRKITMSRIMTESRTDKEVINTMLHEIAHAIDFETRGRSAHDDVWRSIALSIGCDGNRSSNVDVEVSEKNYKWLAICPEHGVLGGWQRKPKDNKMCKKCKSKIIIKENK